MPRSNPSDADQWGAQPGRSSPADLTICDLTGTGAQDTAIAVHVAGLLGDEVRHSALDLIARGAQVRNGEIVMEATATGLPLRGELDGWVCLRGQPL